MKIVYNYYYLGTMQQRLNVTEDENNIEKFQRCTVTIPLADLIKLDIERKKNNYTRSAFIRLVLEDYLIEKKKEITDVERINQKLEKILDLLTSKSK